MTHHPHSPSALTLQSACPGSYNLCKDMPEDTNEFAVEGTMLHEIMAGIPHDMDDEQQEAINKCHAILDQIDKDYTISLVEQKISAKDDLGEELFSGVADVLKIRGAKGLVIDWKFGRKEVAAAENNIQMKAYALAVHDTYGVQMVESFIVQPRIGKISSHIFTDFELIRQELAYIIEMTEDDFAPRILNSGCDYCKGRSKCPEYLAKNSAIVQQDVKALPPIKEWTIDQLWLFHERLAQVEKFGKDVDKELKERGETRPGNLKKTLGSPAVALERCKGYIHLDEFLNVCKPSVPQLLTLLADKRKMESTLLDEKVTKDQAIEWAKHKLGDCYAEIEGEPVLARRKE